jgi:hypothetical protein
MFPFLTCSQFSQLSGYHRRQVNTFCIDHRNFAFQSGKFGRWMIPAQHLERLVRGETVAEIARNPSRPRLGGLSPKITNWLREGAYAP